MKQEMILRDLLAINRGLRINGVSVLYRNPAGRHFFEACTDQPVDCEFPYMGFAPEQRVALSDENNATVYVYDDTGAALRTVQLTFRPDPWTLSQMFNGTPGGLERRMSAPAAAWRRLLEDLKLSSNDLDMCFESYVAANNLGDVGSRSKVLRSLTSNDMDAEGFVTGLLVLGENYLRGQKPVVQKNEENFVTAPLNILIVAASDISIDDRRASIVSRKDGRLVFAMENYTYVNGPATVELVEFDPNTVIELDGGYGSALDIGGNSHRLRFFYRTPVTAEIVEKASSMLAQAVNGKGT